MDAEWVRAVHDDWRSAPLDAVDRAICEYAQKLTLEPAKVGAQDLEALRARGLDDRALHDLVQVVGYFNYINRVADGLGTDPEPEFAPRP